MLVKLSCDYFNFIFKKVMRTICLPMILSKNVLQSAANINSTKQLVQNKIPNGSNGVKQWLKNISCIKIFTPLIININTFLNVLWV